MKILIINFYQNDSLLNSNENKFLPNDTLNSNDIIEENKSQIFQENNNNKDEDT